MVLLFLAVQVKQFFRPEFFLGCAPEPYSDHRVTWIALPTSAAIVEVNHYSTSTEIARVEGFIPKADDEHSLSDLERSARNVVIDRAAWHCTPPSKRRRNSPSQEPVLEGLARCQTLYAGLRLCILGCPVLRGFRRVGILLRMFLPSLSSALCRSRSASPLAQSGPELSAACSPSSFA